MTDIELMKLVSKILEVVMWTNDYDERVEKIFKLLKEKLGGAK